jgi:nitrite reductase/ring-hydroxylating ferredoxin subunit
MSRMTLQATRGFIDVGSETDFIRGRFQKVAIAAKDIWVLRTPDDRWYAIKNSCPHRGGPICLGNAEGTFLPSAPGVYDFGLPYRVVECPWHGYEYSLDTGLPVFTALRVNGLVKVSERLVRYDVVVSDKRVLVSLKGH